MWTLSRYLKSQKIKSPRFQVSRHTGGFDVFFPITSSFPTSWVLKGLRWPTARPRRKTATYEETCWSAKTVLLKSPRQTWLSFVPQKGYCKLLILVDRDLPTTFLFAGGVFSFSHVPAMYESFPPPVGRQRCYACTEQENNHRSSQSKIRHPASVVFSFLARVPSWPRFCAFVCVCVCVLNHAFYICCAHFDTDQGQRLERKLQVGPTYWCLWFARRDELAPSTA